MTFDGDTEVSFGNVGRFDRADAFSLAVLDARARQPADRRLPEARRRRSAAAASSGGSTTWSSSTSSAGPRASRSRSTSEAPANAIQVRTRERLKQGEWNHIVMTYDGSGKARGLAVYVNGKLLAVEVLRDALTGPIATDAPYARAARRSGRRTSGRSTTSVSTTAS